MRTLSVVALVLSTGLAASAQSVISAHSGVLHVSEGAVLLDGKEVNQKFGTFPDIKENAKLTTESGRAEILLTPGVFLRIGDDSGIRMVTNRLIDTRVELLSGKAIIESDSPMKDTAVTIVYKDYQVRVRKASVFEIETNPEQIKVYHGEAEVEANGETTVVRAGRLLPFGRAMVTEKFNVKEGDELAKWSMRRSQDVSVANVSAAKSLHDSGGSFGPNGGWFYNSFYSMYTYIPGNGVYWNPYGYGFFSPYTVYNLYYPGNYGGGGYGGGNGNRGGGFSGSNGHMGDQTNTFGRGAANNSLGAYSSQNSGGSFGGNTGGGSFSGASVGSGGFSGAGASAGAAAGGGGGGHAGGGAAGHR
jgi:hypothetical protein